MTRPDLRGKRVAVLGFAIVFGFAIAILANAGYVWLSLTLLFVAAIGIFWIDV